MASTRSALGSFPLLEGLDQGATHAILASAQSRKISAKPAITNKGDAATFLFMVQTGRARYCHLVWDRSVIRRFVSLYPQLAENGLRIALQYLRNYVDRHVGLVTETAVERLAKTLLKLGHESGEVHPDGVEIRTTNDELSGLADISRFTASRALGNWVRSGTISKGRGRILLHAPEALMVD
jgi:hypothetical protein